MKTNLLLLCTLLVSTSLSAQTVVATGNVSAATVTASHWDTGDLFIVGAGGAGTLTIAGGGTVTTMAPSIGAYVGLQPGADGSVTVTGAGSQWDITGYFAIGNEGRGTLLIENGGQVTTHGGPGQGSAISAGGTATVTGTGSRFETQGSLGVLGGLTIASGGNVSAAEIRLDNSTGATVTGAGSVLASSGRVLVGAGAQGKLTISAGGRVSAQGNINIGEGAGVQGEAIVTGAGSRLDAGQDLNVGGGTLGRLTISSGGKGTAVNGTVDGDGTTASTVEVTGTDAEWSNSGNLSIGTYHAGLLTIANGGKVTGQTGIIGAWAGSSGTVNMTGGQWSNSSELRIGDEGNGTLTLSGGTLSATIGNIARNGGSAGNVTVTGGTWTNSDLLVIGNGGSGTLTQTGGSITNTDGEIGRNDGGSGVATVSGGSWTNSGNLYIGKGGNGALTLSGAGTVIVNGGTAYLAYGAGTTGTLHFGAYDQAAPTTAGTLTVEAIAFGSGTGAISFNQTDTLTLSSAISGAGQLVQRGAGTTVLTGASHLTGGDSFTGITTVKRGVLAVDGASAGLTQSDSAIFVGETNGDNGSFLVRNGAQVISSRGYVGLRSGAQGVATVSGTGSLWQSANDLAVGYEGTGTLNLLSGGSVSAAGKTLYLAYGSGSSGTLNFGAYDQTAATTTGTLTVAGIALGSGTAVIDFNQTDALTLAAAISGNGKLLQRGTGTTLLTGANTLTSTQAFDGITTVKQGTLAVSGSGASLRQSSAGLYVGETSGDNGAFNILNGATVSTARAYVGVRAGSVGNVTVSGANSQWQAGAGLAIGNEGSGTLTIAGGGVVTDVDGYIAYNRADSSGSVTVTGAGSQWTHSGTLTVSRNGTGALTLGDSGTVSVGGGSGTVSVAVLAASRGTINFGADDLSHPTTSGTLNAAAIAFGAGTGAINFNQTNAFTLGATISGGGTLYQRGTGTTSLTAASTFSGGTQILGGTLKLSEVGAGHSVLGTGPVSVGPGGRLTGSGGVLGATSVAGTLAVGTTISRMSFASDLSLLGTSDLLMTLGGFNRGVTFDAIDVGGHLTFGGTLTVSFVSGFSPSSGSTFDLFDATGGTSGAFSSIVFTTSGYTGTFDAQTGVLALTSSPIPEPSTYAALAGSVMLGWAAWRRRRRKSAAA